MKKKENKEEQKNPFHKEYGPVSNTKYVLKNLIKYEKRFIGFFAISIITAPFMSYLWTFISKFVIDIITNQKTVKELGTILGITFVIQIVVTMLQSFATTQSDFRYIIVRFKMMNINNYKSMTTRFENLENTDVMDCYQKAMNAVSGNEQGLEGMMRTTTRLIESIMVSVVGLVIIGTLSVPIVIGMTVLAVVNFLIKNKTNKKTKKEIWDPLATWWRKNYYMQNVSTDFKFAKDIRMYGLTGYIKEKYHKLNEERIASQRKNALIWWVTGQIGNILWMIAQAGLYAWLIYSVFQGNMTIGNFTMYLGVAATYFNYLGNMLDRVNDLLQRSRELDDFRSFEDFDDKRVNGTKKVPKYEKYEFVFDNVSFKYPKAEKYALKNLNLTVKAGERLAVVGLNGAGKSTFIKLLLRLYEPTEGRILLNGEDIKDYEINDYYKTFSPVFQDVNLFAFPLSENISMDTPEATDEGKAKESLIKAGMEEKLNSLSNGVKTEVLKVIHDDGVDFSGGEKQKIALARALYKDAPVVVLDEPTAALDALAEAKLYEDFDKLVGNKTAVYISHRLSSTQFCAHVAMFMDGELVEYGTHESLLAAGGPYSEMFNVQAQYYIEGGKENGEE